MKRVMALGAMAALAMSLTACATIPAQNGGTAPGGGVCSNDGLDAFVGRTVTEQLGTELLRVSGARALRWGPPGSAMTMDYREDRLTVSYDEAMKVTMARCG